MTAAQREIHVGWDVSLTDPNLRRLTAECDVERTELLFLGPPLFDESDLEALLAGPVGRAALEEHRARCAACRRWEVPG